jgi:dTDP-4-amino-4,6-dideoxygalactose transaminase
MSGKHHATGGQGGVVYTRDEDLHWKGKRFADRGKPFQLDAPANVVAGLNCNLNDLSAAIGAVQIKKLPEAIRRRRAVGEAIREALRDNEIVRVGWQVPDTESVYWFLRLYLDLERLTVGKAQFCEALEAEGIPVNPSYRHIPAEALWYRERSKADLRVLTNAVSATDTHFNIHFHERYGPKEAEDIIRALLKVAHAYRR